MAHAIVVGPLVVLFLFSAFCSTALIAMATGHIEIILHKIDDGKSCWGNKSLLHILWGICAILLCFLLCAFLINTHVLALLGIALAIVSACFASAGAYLGCWVIGEKVAILTGELDPTQLVSIRIGFCMLFLASLIPFIGWVVGIIVACSGIGSLLEVLIRPKRVD